MKKSADVIYLTRKEWDAFKEEEHRERVALSQRVASGELTPEQANCEASIFKDGLFDPALARTLNLDEMLTHAARLRLPGKRNGRKKQKTVRA